MTTKTETKLYEMLTENTGKHLLDSGGAYGRNWQRNQALTIEDFQKSPEAIFAVDQYGWQAEISVFHYLSARLQLTERATHLQNQFVEWLAEDSERSAYSCLDLEDFAQSIADDNGHSEINPETVFNSYNWENFLSQTLQGVVFEYGGNSYVALQIHGGADVRGGYTYPQIFELKQPGFYFLCDSSELFFGCSNTDCEFSAYLQQYSAETNDGRDVDLKRLNEGCPDCGGKTFYADLPEPIY